MKKLLKIWGVALTVLLVASMFAVAPAPVEAAPGNMTWTAQTVPTGTGNVIAGVAQNVADVAVAGDGTTVYAIDGAQATPSATSAIFRSTNAGQSFTAATVLPAGAVTPLVAIAVASDNPDVIAVTDGALVYTSSNGGTTWSALPAHGTAGVIMDVAVGPARSGTLLGREYAIALADPAAATIALGDVMDIGGTATWGTSAAGLTGTNDYMSVVFSYNFVGDRCLVVVGSSATFAKLQILNTATNTVVRTTIFGTTTIDFNAAAANSILSADIAIPMDFDPTTASGQRSYVVIASVAPNTDNDVYRIDAGTPLDLGAGGAGAPIHSVAYAGTVDEGTVFVGYSTTNTVKFSTNAQVSLPTWTTTKKAPGIAATTNIVVRVAPDFSSTNRVFAGSSGAENALYVSENGGVTFDAESLINMGVATITAINDIAVSSDGKTLFMVTNDGAQIHLWKSTTPVTSTSWSRIYVFTPVAATTALVRTNPDWESTPAVYLIDQAAGGSIFYSSNGGDIFATRNGPTAAACVDMAVQEGTTVYFASGTNVYKSSTSAWTWGLPVSAKAGAINDLAVAMPDHLLVGGTGNASYSTDAAGSFTQITGNGGEVYLILADDDYEDNNTIYVADTAATTGQVYRFVIGEDTTLEALGNPNVTPILPVVGLGMANGVIYVQSDASAVAVAAGVIVGSGCDRNLNPRTASGTVAATWDTLITGLNAAAVVAPALAGFTVGGDDNGNTMYSHDGTVTLRAFGDMFAVKKPILQSPGDGASVGIDPVNGRADLVTLTWEPLGTGIGAGNRVDMQIRKKGDSWTAAAANNNQGVTSSSPAVTMAAVGATWINAMTANTEYEWRVRFDRAVSGEIIRTNWSNPFTLKVQAGTVVNQPHAGPVILSPAGGSTTGLNPGISWAPYSGATKYQVILSTDSMGQNRVAGTPVFVDVPAWQPTAPLEYDTTYFAFITAVEPTVSPQSVISFTVMAKPTPAPTPQPPVVIEQQPPQPAPVINFPEPAPPVVTQPIIWTIIIIGVVLIIVVIVLIIRTRRPM